MCGVQAKRLRRLIYGDMAVKGTEYTRYGNTVESVGLRRKYKIAKQLYKKSII